MKLTIYNRANAGMSKAKMEMPTMRISSIGQFVLNRELVSMMKLTEKDNKIDVCYDETQNAWYLVRGLTQNSFVSRPKGGNLPYEAGSVFQSRKLKEQLFEKEKLESDFSYSFLVSKSFATSDTYPGRYFWPIITASATKIINRKLKK